MTYLGVIRDGPLPGATNMARDRDMLAAHSAGDDPLLRIYRWSPPALSIGYNQNSADFDAAAVTSQGYDLVQRPTGGRAILHAQELTYAVVGTSPSVLFGSSLHDTYQTINRALLAFLLLLGIEADVSPGESRAAGRGLSCFHSAGQHEIRVGGKKLIGSAQRRTGKVFLQHGSILTGPTHADLAGFQQGDPARRSSRQELLSATTDLGQLLAMEPVEANYRQWSEMLLEAFVTLFALPARELALPDQR